MQQLFMSPQYIKFNLMEVTCILLILVYNVQKGCEKRNKLHYMFSIQIKNINK